MRGMSLRRRLRSLRPRLPPVQTLAAFLTVLLITFGVRPAAAQGTVPGQFVVPLGYCQLSATALGSAVDGRSNRTRRPHLSHRGHDADGADAAALAVAEENVEGAKRLLESTIIDQGRTHGA
jgi:hypothetical protein